MPSRDDEWRTISVEAGGMEFDVRDGIQIETQHGRFRIQVDNNRHLSISSEDGSLVVLPQAANKVVVVQALGQEAFREGQIPPRRKHSVEFVFGVSHHFRTEVYRRLDAGESLDDIKSEMPFLFPRSKAIPGVKRDAEAPKV